MWYRRAAEQGDGLAQYSLGLLYDRGQGVPRDIVVASKWLNLATSAARPRAREARARIRDAGTTKMTCAEIAEARMRALEWAPSREHSRAGRPRLGPRLAQMPSQSVSQLAAKTSPNQPSQMAGARNRPNGRNAVRLNGLLRSAVLRT